MTTEQTIDQALVASQDTEYPQLVRQLDSAKEGEKKEFHLREMGVALREVALTHLEDMYASGMPMVDIIKIMHKLNSQGWELFDDENEAINAGKYREYLVSVGETIPPLPEDIQQLMETFTSKLDELMAQSRTIDSQLVAAWAFTMLTAIHPFEDVNGRTGRTLVSFVLNHIQKSKGLSSEKLSLPEKGDVDKDDFTLEVADLLNDLHISPRHDNVTDYVDWFTHRSATEQRAILKHEAELISYHIKGIKSVEDLHQYQKLNRAASFIKDRSPQKGKTRSLAAVDAAKVFGQRLGS